MKKLIIILLLLISPFIKVSAESSFSEWSTVKPQLENIILETEERYLYYTISETDIEYMKYVDFLASSKEQIDFNEYNLTELEKIDSPLPESMHYIQSNKIVNVKEAVDDIQYIKIGNYKATSENIKIKDISFTDTSTMLNIPYTTYLEHSTNHNQDESITLLNNGDITFKLDTTYKAADILITFVILRDEEEISPKNIYLYYYNKNNFSSYYYSNLYEYDYNLLVPVSLSINTEGISLQANYQYRDKVIYYVSYKLYKTFNYDRQDIGYYTSLEGDYLKDEEPITFYRYKLIDNESESNTEEESSGDESENTSEEVPSENETGNTTEEESSENETGNTTEEESLENETENTEGDSGNDYAEDPTISNEEDVNNSNINNSTDKTSSNEINNNSCTTKNEYNYEYLYEYPINYEDNLKDYNVYSKEEISEEVSSNKEFIAVNTSKEDNEVPFYKIFFFVSYICLLILLIILLVNRILKRSSYVENV